jgi:hypothetical protein
VRPVGLSASSGLCCWSGAWAWSTRTARQALWPSAAKCGGLIGAPLMRAATSTHSSGQRSRGLWRPCSQFAHSRCGYTWTLEHTSVASLQLRRTTVDASVRRGTGWSGSNPGIPTMFAVPVGLGPTHASGPSISQAGSRMGGCAEVWRQGPRLNGMDELHCWNATGVRDQAGPGDAGPRAHDTGRQRLFYTYAFIATAMLRCSQNFQPKTRTPL